ncbi:MAG: hypothetical protein GY810_20620 [Aureispira sp.]|nr:hypothetical protein [Aureispira sp.]
MRKSRLVHVFYALTSSQRLLLRKAVYSPIFNKREDIQLLLEYMYKIDPISQKNLLDRETVFKQLFPKQKFDMQQLRYTMSFLLKVLEDVLIYQQATKDEFQNKLYLARAYRELKAPKFFEQTIQKARQDYGKQNLRDISNLKNAYSLELESYLATQEQGRTKPKNLQKLNDAFDIQYIAEKLKQACRILSYQTVYKEEYQTGLLAEVLGYVGNHKLLLNIPAVALYYYYYKAATEVVEGASFFDQFKHELLQAEGVFSDVEMRDLHVLAINYGIKRLNTEQGDYYLQETFDLYKIALTKDYLSEQGELSRFAFTNIVSIALKLKEYKWTWDFIESYKEHLNTVVRETYVHHSLSKWHFEQKQYDEAMLLLQQADYDDLLLNLSSKIMLLKIYYELSEYEVLDALLNSFKTFLSRKKLLAYHKENYRNVIRLTNKLVNVNPFSKTAKAKLRQEIEQTKVLTERAWLLQQLDQL